MSDLGTKIPRAWGQLESPLATVIEPVYSRACAPQKEKPVHCNKDPVHPKKKKKKEIICQLVPTHIKQLFLNLK